MKNLVGWLVDWTNSHSGTGQWLSAAIALVAVLSALWIGIVQTSINQKLEKIEDTVEVYGYLVQSINPNVPIFLRVTNVGKLQVYVISYSIDGAATSTPSTLIPAGQQQNAWFDVPLSGFSASTTNMSITLKLQDQINRSWESKMTVTKTTQGFSVSVSKIKQD